MIVVYIVAAVLGLYLAIGLTVAVLDTLERRRRHSIRLSSGDVCLFVFAWPLLFYVMRRGINLDNT